MNLIRIPTRFFDDHQERELPTPEVIKATKSNYWISADDRDLPELLNDAEHYSDMLGYMESYYFGLCMSARATAKAIRKAQS